MKMLSTSENNNDLHIQSMLFFLVQLGLINRGRWSYYWGGRAFVRGTLCELEKVKILIEF